MVPHGGGGTEDVGHCQQGAEVERQPSERGAHVELCVAQIGVVRLLNGPGIGRQQYRSAPNDRAYAAPMGQGQVAAPLTVVPYDVDAEPVAWRET